MLRSVPDFAAAVYRALMGSRSRGVKEPRGQ